MNEEERDQLAEGVYLYIVTTARKDAIDFLKMTFKGMYESGRSSMLTEIVDRGGLIVDPPPTD